MNECAMTERFWGKIFFLRSRCRNVPISRLSGNFVQKSDENGQKKLSVTAVK